MDFLLALDQGTSSSRSIIFDGDGQIVCSAQCEFAQIYPQAGWVEHDPMELWHTQLKTAQEVLLKAGISAKQIKAVGITNQRETTVVWDRITGQPICNAIVWQDRRAESTCVELRQRGLAPLIHQKTGLIVDAYFSGTKLEWLLDHVSGARELAQQGKLAFGTVDSWLLWQLTKGQVHATDVTNASRTMLFNIHTNQWDDELLQALNIPKAMMPAVYPSVNYFGQAHSDFLGVSIPIHGIAGDQQSALFGQACFATGMAKNTYGTGCFMLMNTGHQFNLSNNHLLTTSAAQSTRLPEYAMEGSVFIGGAVVQWLRDGLRAIGSSPEVEDLAQTVPDSGGVIFVPGFTGLGAPYWNAQARGLINGITRGTSVAHIARAALESIAFQSTALLRAMSLDCVATGGAPLSELRVDGGACVNNLLMQFQADLLGIPVVRPKVTETTALGAAYLAGLGAGIFQNTQELSTLWQEERRFIPSIERSKAEELMQNWEYAVRQATLSR
jgi:glycerol kinase